MRMALFAILGLPVGYLVGNLTGTLVWCTIQPSNLCGLVGVFITGPIGAIGCAGLGIYLGRSKGS
jgi:hypothetical protein